MFIVILRFSEGKAKAGQFLKAHNEWLQRGFGDGVFVLAGSLQDNAGGAIVARCASREDLNARLNADPFVAEGIVRVEILGVIPSKTDERLDFLK